MTNSVIDIKNVSFGYEDSTVVEEVNLQVERGAFLGLVGQNGSGKSTLIKLMLGFLKPDEGSISLFGKPLHKFKEWNKVGFVSQKANSFNSGFPATVLEVVLMGLASKVGLFRFYSKKDKQKAIDALEAVGMKEFRHKNIGELSGGQQQRVFIARALVSDPELMILDEPTVGVDVSNVNAFYELLDQLNKQRGITMLLVTHDLGTITERATHIACINKRLHFHGESQHYNALNEEELSELYGHPIKKVVHNH